MAVALALAPHALGGAPCESEETALDQDGAAARAGWGESCPEPGTRGRFVEAGVVAAGVRVEVVWETWQTPHGNETTLAVSAPPRFVLWHDDAYGCGIDVNVAGTTRLPCLAGRPPAPPALP